MPPPSPAAFTASMGPALARSPCFCGKQIDAFRQVIHVAATESQRVNGIVASTDCIDLDQNVTNFFDSVPQNGPVKDIGIASLTHCTDFNRIEPWHASSASNIPEQFTT